MPEYTIWLKIYTMSGHFVHNAVTGYDNVHATCTLSASATVHVAHTIAHPLNQCHLVNFSDISYIL